MADQLIDVRRDRRAGWARQDEHDLSVVTLTVRSQFDGADDASFDPALAADASTRELGTVMHLRDVLSSAHRHGVRVSSTARRGFDRATVSRTHTDGVVVQLAELASMYAAVDALTSTLRDRQLVGVSLIDTSPTVARSGLLRCWPHGATRPELVRHRQVSIGVTDGSMDVTFGDARSTIHDVRSFQLGVEGAVVVDADDVEHVLDDDATTAFCRLAPESTGFRVRRVPEVLAWADLRAALESTLEDALNAGCGARVGLRPPSPVSAYAAR